MSATQAKVARIPNCDMLKHGDRPVKAYADARLPHDGRWAYVCRPCFNAAGCTLGLGRGQELILAR